MAVSSADVPEQPVGEECLSFTIRGPWAHFRRIEGNIVKQTYRLIPRTTTAGIVAAMLGLARDSYYDLFGPDVSAVAIEPRSELRTMNVPENTLSTEAAALETHPSRGHARISVPDPSKNRQQHNYEMLVEPAYRLDVVLEDAETRSEFGARLDRGESYYPPSLGLSECLATVTYHGEFDVQPGAGGDEVTVDSAVVEAVDDVQMDAGVRVRTERSPGFMSLDGGGRITDRFVSYAYNPEGGPLTVTGAPTCTVDGRQVMFV